jgi:hypothetical protein
VNWRVCFEYLPYLERSCSVIEYCKLTFNFNIHLRFCPPWTPISILRPQPLTLFLLLFHHPGRTTTSTSRLQKLKPPSSQTYSICHQPPHLSNTTYLPSIHNPYSPPLSKSPLSPLPLQTPPRHIQPLTKPPSSPRDVPHRQLLLCGLRLRPRLALGHLHHSGRLRHDPSSHEGC